MGSSTWRNWEIKLTQSFLTLQNLSSEHIEDPTPSHSRLPSQIISEQEL